jgi:hypothetical protein
MNTIAAPTAPQTPLFLRRFTAGADGIHLCAQGLYFALDDFMLARFGWQQLKRRPPVRQRFGDLPGLSRRFGIRGQAFELIGMDELVAV